MSKRKGKNLSVPAAGPKHQDRNNTKRKATGTKR